MASIDPHADTKASKRARASIEKAVVDVFALQKKKAIAYTEHLFKSRLSNLFKVDDPEDLGDNLADEVIAEFTKLPQGVRPGLEDAFLSGMNTAILQLSIHDVDMIATMNQQAMEFASERAAELIGKSYTADGHMVDNPNAEWAISDTTRDKLKRIVADAFEHETTMSDIRDRIVKTLEADDAGIFTAERALMIAQTEVAHAQAGGNFEMWKASGLVETIRWLVSNEGPCDICEENEDEVVDFGDEFPSGDTMPPAHPNCRCVIVAVDIAEAEE